MIAFNTFLAGLFYLLAGMSGLTRHFLLHPTVPEGTPRTPAWLLSVVFAFSVVMVYSGLRFLTVWYTDEAVDVPPGVTGYGVLLAGSIFGYKISMLIDTIRRKPVWAMADLIKALNKE